MQNRKWQARCFLVLERLESQTSILSHRREFSPPQNCSHLQGEWSTSTPYSIFHRQHWVMPVREAAQGGNRPQPKRHRRRQLISHTARYKLGSHWPSLASHPHMPRESSKRLLPLFRDSSTLLQRWHERPLLAFHSLRPQ